MGRFSNKVSAAARETRNIIKINLYEQPEYALQAIANICQKNNIDDASVIIGSLRSELNKKKNNGLNFYNFIDKYRSIICEFDFIQKIRDLLDDIMTELLAHENTSDTQVAVAGGFSAGKSSFLNALTQSSGLLPTGIDPVSMVSTYLYCDREAKEITVKGINLKNAIVLLDTEILSSIQHESKSKVYLASVLKKLFVEIPNDQLDGFVFIDTPGYNNSEKKNDSNNQTDEETALAAIDNGNVLLWIIDAGAGTVPKRDLEIINYYLTQKEGRKVGIIFNKADKKGETEIKKIVDATYKELSSLGDDLIDVLGYSSTENRIYYSVHGYDMPTLLEELRKCGNGNSRIEQLITQIVEMFDLEIEYANEVLKELNKERKNLIDRKNEAYKYYENERDGSKEYIQNIEDIMVTNYDELKDKLDHVIKMWGKCLDLWGESLSAINNTNNSNFTTKSNIRDLINKYFNKYYDNDRDFDQSIKPKYYSTKDRKEWVENIKAQLDRVDENIKNSYESLENQIDEETNDVEKFQNIVKFMEEYRDIFRHILPTCIKDFRLKAHKVQDARVRNQISSSDIFSAIRSGNFNKFTLCFGNGVKMSEFNSEGYSPLTYAVKYGANDMVNFFIEQKADLNALDKRGLNAFLTAVENGYKDIIAILLEHDNSLALSKSSKGEGALEIASNQSFYDWLKINLNN